MKLAQGDMLIGYLVNRKLLFTVGDRSRDWPEGSLFNSYYTKV